MKHLILITILTFYLSASSKEQEAKEFIAFVKNSQYNEIIKKWQELMPIRYKAYTTKKSPHHNRAFKQKIYLPPKQKDIKP